MHTNDAILHFHTRRSRMIAALLVWQKFFFSPPPPPPPLLIPPVPQFHTWEGTRARGLDVLGLVWELTKFRSDTNVCSTKLWDQVGFVGRFVRKCVRKCTPVSTHLQTCEQRRMAYKTSQRLHSSALEKVNG